jgi:hypothetical protein
VEEIKMFPSFNQEETNLISTVDRIRREVMTRVMEYLEHVEEKIENRGIDYHTVPYLWVGIQNQIRWSFKESVAQDTIVHDFLLYSEFGFC